MLLFANWPSSRLRGNVICVGSHCCTGQNPKGAISQAKIPPAMKCVQLTENLYPRSDARGRAAYLKTLWWPASPTPASGISWGTRSGCGGRTNGSSRGSWRKRLGDEQTGPRWGTRNSQSGLNLMNSIWGKVFAPVEAFSASWKWLKLDALGRGPPELGKSSGRQEVHYPSRNNITVVLNLNFHI